MGNKLKLILKKPTTIFLAAIFFLALIVRFIYFKDSVYFGYDEARDAYISQSIYLEHDLKIIGPAANYPGLNHGPLYWYFVGPLYLIGNGNPFFVSAVFRIVNALGIFLIFFIGKKLFNTSVGIVSALLYAVSFEQTQYAMYVGNPSLAVLSMLTIFLGAAMFFKDKNKTGLLLLWGGAAVSTQLELILLYTFVLVVILLVILKDKLKAITVGTWIKSFFVTALLLSTFLVAELKYGFQSIKAFIALLGTGYDVLPENKNRLTLYGDMLTQLFQFNILNIHPPFIYLLTIIVIGTLLFLVIKSRNKALIITLVWIFGSLLILPFGSYNAFYVNVGIGSGIILGSSYLLYLLWNRSRSLFIFAFLGVIISNLLLITKRNKDSLIVDIKAQEFMKLEDEISLINKTFETADGKGFTIRTTGMPYKVQTVWAYLYNQYGLKKYGYLPFWETEEVEGYPGKLPRPSKDSTCTRFLIREPVRGIPENLILADEREENIFSEVINEENIGHFLLQTRQANGDCHNETPRTS